MRCDAMQRYYPGAYDGRQGANGEAEDEDSGLQEIGR
jgi:hypothetical protein